MTFLEENINQIIHADCFDIMPKIEDGSVDLILTDPPYGLGFRGQSWDNEVPCWIEVAKLKSDNIVFTTAPLNIYDYPKPDWIGCWYRPASNSRNLSGGFNHWSPIMIYSKKKIMVDCINLHAISNSQEKHYFHPSPKPIKLFEWILKTFTNEGDLILDPFSGSGTLAIACINTRRNYICIEKDKGYYEKSLERVKEAQRQLRLAI